MDEPLPMLTDPPVELAVMQYVLENARVPGETEAITNARELLAKYLRTFYERMARLEHDWMVTEKAAWEARALEAKLELAKLPSTQAPSEEPEAPDEGAERAIAAAEKLLDNLHQQDAKLAAQPGTTALAGQFKRALEASTCREKMLHQQINELRRRVDELEKHGVAPASREAHA
jgi:hypothetical protein